MVLGFVSVLYCIFAFCLLLLLPFPQMCSSGEGVQGRKRRASTFRSPGWRGCYSTCLGLEIFVQSSFSDSSPRHKMHWLFLFSFYIRVPVDSPCLVDAKDSGATVTCGGGRGFPSALPMGDPLTSLFPPTPGALPFKLCSPSHLPAPLSGYSKFQGVAWEYRLQTKSWRRRK